MEITSIQDLRNHLRRCRHLTVYRELLGYNHHVFVGNANQSGCDIYHYKLALEPCLTFFFPAQVTKERLDYSSYSNNREIKKIFNFERGDRVVIVNRKDYPKSIDAEENCIRRAESRVGGRNYSPAYNNCESFVNWVFSGDNTSHEYKNALFLKMILANIIDEVTIDLIFKLLETVCYQFFNFFSGLWDTFSNFFKQTQQEQKEGHHIIMCRMTKNCCYYIKPMSHFSLREKERKKFLYFNINIRKVLQHSSCIERVTIIIHNEFYDIEVLKEFCVKIEVLLKKKAYSQCKISEKLPYDINDAFTQKTLCFGGVSVMCMLLSLSFLKYNLCTLGTRNVLQINSTKLTDNCRAKRSSCLRKTIRKRKLAIGICCIFLNDKQKTEYCTCFLTMLYRSVYDGKRSGEMQSEALSLWCKIKESFFLVKNNITCRNIYITYDQLQNLVSRISICFLASDYGCVYGLEEGKTTFPDSAYDSGLNSSSFCLEKSHTIQRRNYPSFRFDDSKIPCLEYSCTHESMVSGDTRLDDANKLLIDRQNTENPSFTLLYQLYDLRQQYHTKLFYEHDKQKHSCAMQIRLAYKPEPKRWLTTVDIKYYNDHIKDLQVQKHVCRYSSCFPWCDHGCMFPDLAFDFGISSPSLCFEKSHIIQGRDSPSFGFDDSEFQSFEYIYKSMACGGNRLDDANSLFNDRQNKENPSFPQLDDLCQLQQFPDKNLYEHYKSFNKHDKKQSYGMHSPSAYISEGTKFIAKTYLNNKDLYMTDAQVQERVCRDSFSSLGGVYGCVYGSQLAETISYNSEYASKIGCWTVGTVGIAAGAAGGALVCSNLLPHVL